MTGGSDRVRLARCVEEGAVAIIDKSMDVATLIHLAHDAGTVSTLLARTERYRLDDALREHRAQRRAERRPLEMLTPREREVLRDLTLGFRAREIAERSFVSLSTVRSQIKSILAKLDTRSQVQAISMAMRSHWFGPPDTRG
jgi:DNA-binding NarL/FixJ family response regulator